MSAGEANGGASPSKGPLTGVKVLEFGSIYAGPFCCQLLADMGADVIKVERPGFPDPMRSWAHTDDENTSYSWAVVSRNKKCVTLDVRDREGAEIFRELASRSDVLVENFRPGRMESWGLGPDVLCERNPRLIYARVSGFGQTGPYAMRPGFGVIGEAMSGLRSITGYPDRPPVRAGVSIADAIAGMFTAYGVAASLHERATSGKGQVIDTALYEGLFALMSDFIAIYEALGVVKEPVGAKIPRVVPNGIFRTADGQYVVLATGTDAVFARFAKVMGRKDLAEKYPTPAARADNEDELIGVIEAWIATRPIGEVLETLRQAEVPGVKVYRAPDILADPQYAAREMLMAVPWKGGGTVHIPGVVPKLSRTPGGVRSFLPELGQHSDEVYANILGMSAEAIEKLRSRKVI